MGKAGKTIYFKIRPTYDDPFYDKERTTAKKNLVR